MEVESREDVERLVAESLPGPVAQIIIRYLQPAVRFNGVLSPGRRPALRLGGGAALPPDIPWPEHEGRMMHLVAVVDLEQVAEVDPWGLLPRSGLLHFFYDAIASVGGYDPDHQTAWSVILVADHAVDDQHPVRYRDVYPGDEVCYSSPVLLEERFGKPFVQWTIPDEAEEEVAGIDWERNERGGIAQIYWNGLDSLNYEVRIRTEQMFGWPTVIQNSMRLKCQLVSNGLFCGDSSGYESPEAAELREGTYDWVLLLQVNSWAEHDNGGRWGTDGMLYFWIRREDLRLARFGRVWVILQT
jgi:uncharacterized protein YwqG